MERLQNYKNNNVAKTKDIKPTENKNSGNTLLSAEEQINTNKNPVKERKEVDLSSFMKKKMIKNKKIYRKILLINNKYY